MSTSGTGDGNTDRHRGFSLGGPANFADGVKAALTTVAIGLALVAPLISVPDNASAANKREIGSISASGFLFKVKFLKVWVCWSGGGVLAIVGGRGVAKWMHVVRHTAIIPYAAVFTCRG